MKKFPLIVLGALIALSPSYAAEDIAQLNDSGLAAHRKRSLTEASSFYSKVLKLEPPVAASPAQLELVKKYAPRLNNVANEFFPLKDIVAILHPDRPVIGYHLFWEDDIGYPSDNEPCDHELVWVEYDPASGKVTRISTYFHGAILAPEAAVTDANAHGGRPAIAVEWGFHGSIPEGGLKQAEPTLRQHWDLIHNRAKERPRDPLARGWPTEYGGDYQAYGTFDVPNDPVSRLTNDGLVFVSRWPNATINRFCLRYNFAAKTEWPWLPADKK